MDWHYVADVLFGLLSAVGGFVVTMLVKRLDKLEEKVQATELELAKGYVTKADLAGLQAALVGRLDTIAVKLEHLELGFARMGPGTGERRVGM